MSRELSRRDFLRLSAGATAAGVAVGPAAASPPSGETSGAACVSPPGPRSVANTDTLLDLDAEVDPWNVARAGGESDRKALAAIDSREQRALLAESNEALDAFDDVAGHPSRDGYRALAESERDFQLRQRERFYQADDGGDADDPGAGVNSDPGEGVGNSSAGGGPPSGAPTSPDFAERVNAVADLGMDPNGGEAIDSKLASAVEDGRLIYFPKGTYRWDGVVDLNPGGGTFGLVGEGFDSGGQSGPPEPGQAAVFKVSNGSKARFNTGSIENVLLANFVIDQSATNACGSIVLGASGFGYARDIRQVGVLDDVGSARAERENASFVSILAREGATCRATRCVAVGTCIPGSKNVGGAAAFWVGGGNSGTAQIEDAYIRGAGDNGIYGSRTEGEVHVIGGTYINNEVSQIRYSGEGSFADGVTMIVDATKYQGPPGMNGKGFNEKIGLQGIKVETASQISKQPGAVARNIDLQMINAKKVGACIFLRGHAGAFKIENCRILNTTSFNTVYAEEPGSSYDPKRPGPQNVSVASTTFEGAPASPTVDIRGRPNSTVVDTCLKYTGADGGDIEGASTSNVTYGLNCSGTGASEDVGSASGALGDVANWAVNGASGIISAPLRIAGGAIAAPLIGLILVAALAISPLLILALIALGVGEAIKGSK